ncbi:reverse transcriptase-like protein [bacterium]|nr:MAG: reverse transcriptase-like protein [bacterium]
MIHNSLTIFTDGGARGNPGPAALGVVIYNSEGKILKKYGKYLGEKTNNEAEYEAVISALESAVALGAETIYFRLDSELVVRQLSGIYKVKNPRMQALIIRARNLETEFKKINYSHIPREKNQLADELVNAAIDQETKILP